ncbi:MAG: hypothetical protein DM484_21495, partial [Candidatus Methylumidiphilus alinenensis]
MVGVVRVGIFAINHDYADLNAGVNRLHLGNILLGKLGIGVGLVWDGVSVVLPRAIVLIANFPIFEPVLMRHVGIAYPCGRLLRSAAAIVDSDEGLRTRTEGDIGKAIKVTRPLIVGFDVSVSLPVILVCLRTTRKAQCLVVDRLQQGNACGGVERPVPHGC